MKIIDYLKNTNDINFFINLMVYEHTSNDKEGETTFYNFHTIDGKKGMKIWTFSKEEASKEAEKYLNQEIVNFNFNI